MPRVETVKVASCPPGPAARLPVPSRLPSAKNWTVPVGSPAVAVTRAVIVTAWLANDGLGVAEEMVMVVSAAGAALIVSVYGSESSPSQFRLAAYLAVIV